METIPTATCSGPGGNHTSNKLSEREESFLSDKCRVQRQLYIRNPGISVRCYRFGQEIYEISNLDAFNISCHQI